MAITPDFKAAAYNINCILNGLMHEWCDGRPRDIQDFATNINALRDFAGSDYLAARHPAQAQALREAFIAVENGGDREGEKFSAALDSVVRAVPEIAAHHVSFSAYSGIVSSNRARVLANGGTYPDPNLRP